MKKYVSKSGNKPFILLPLSFRFLRWVKRDLKILKQPTYIEFFCAVFPSTN